MNTSLLQRTVTKRPGRVLLRGRILFLTEDPELIKRQLAGEDLPWDTAHPERNPKLRDDISTDEITPAHICFFFDETLGEFPYTGLKCGNETPIKRGKILSKEDLDRLGGFSRYKDVDGDGIPYRTLPGTDHPAAAYFTRGSGHNEKSQYSERPDDFERNMERINRKFETARSFVPRPEVVSAGKSKIGIIAYGTSHWAITESRDQLRNEYKFETDYLRLKAYPFTREVHDFIEKHDRVYVVEQNRDAQMLSLLKLDLKPELITRLRSLAHITGLPLDARSITDELTSMEGK